MALSDGKTGNSREAFFALLNTIPDHGLKVDIKIPAETPEMLAAKKAGKGVGGEPDGDEQKKLDADMMKNLVEKHSAKVGSDGKPVAYAVALSEAVKEFNKTQEGK